MEPSRPKASPVMIALAMGALYFFWGSTYYGIKVAVQGYEPFFMAGIRSLIAGAIIYLFVRLRGVQRPPAGAWKHAAIIGGLLLLGGNGLVTYTSQYLPSGLVSVIVATLPLWMVIFDRSPTSRITPLVITGVLVGFGGVVFLIGPRIAAAMNASEQSLSAMQGFAIVICLFSPISWALGSLYSRWSRKQAVAQSAPFRDTGMQLLCGGGLLLIASAALGEPWRMTADKLFTTPWPTVAVAYLIIFGSLVGYSAYIWLLSVAPTSRVATYAYVNPVVALLIGWGIGGESLSGRTILAASVIIGSVAVIVTARASPAPAAPGNQPEAPEHGK